jgi:hypothetical protein
VDPLSRLPRVLPHSSPLQDDIPSIVPDDDKQQAAHIAKDRETFVPARKAASVALWWSNTVEQFEAFPIQTRRQKKVSEENLDPEDVKQDILNGIPREELPEEGEGSALPFQSSDP